MYYYPKVEKGPVGLEGEPNVQVLVPSDINGNKWHS